ncbi:unnamed protein product [Cyprideis torosa]|uniref:Ferritin/DPS domain-containing protein n=1 Tax=Cyprideis torosa TaxID=163714 RepID=A0A7R8W6L3_9CRUS|nr:unnamed protein product [Cyprideis torosa]CAG0881447.1 unnamed protein product [Cyprideis torosa]
MYLTGFVVFEFLVIASVLGEEYPCYHLRGELAYQHVDDQYRILHGCSSGTGNMNHHHHELQNLLNRAILDSLEYLEMSAQFGRDGVSWEGFKKYFEYLSDRSWKMALKLAEYGNRRGRALSAIEFKSPAIEIAEFGELEALTFAVDKEKELMNGLMDLHKEASAEATYDPDGRAEECPATCIQTAMKRPEIMRNKSFLLFLDCDVCFVGIPIDTGTSNRPGTRFGPRQIRSESILLRNYNKDTGASPFEGLKVSDLGDIPVNLYNHSKAIDIIRRFMKEEVLDKDCKPISLGGDHSITFPILQAITAKFGPVALIHVDAHMDIGSAMMGEPLAHATGKASRRLLPDRALRDGLVWQIGIRGTGYEPSDYDFALEHGFHVIEAQNCWHKSLVPLMEKIRKHIGREQPVYISFDIDGIDPAFAPGTGTPEPGGLTSIQSIEIIRGCRGLNIVGADLVEVSIGMNLMMMMPSGIQVCASHVFVAKPLPPPQKKKKPEEQTDLLVSKVSPVYDTTGNTSLLAANLLMEMLCVFPGVPYHPRPTLDSC